MSNRSVLPIETEYKACDDMYGSIIRYIKKQPDYTVNEDLLKRAYETAKSLHKDTRRISGELYLWHPLRVMETLSRIMCKSGILAAALLHDTIEDCGYTEELLRENFSPEVAGIVSAVTAIKEDEANFERLSEQDKHELIDQLTDEKLIRSKYQREAFLVRFADREHNLSTIKACSPEKRRLKIEQTETFLIPAARHFGMRYFEITLSDHCFKFAEDAFESEALKKFRNDCISVSGFAFSEFDFLLQESVADQDYFSFPTYNPFARLRGSRRNKKDELQIEKRRVLKPFEIKCQVQERMDYTRGDVYLSEVILTCKDRNKFDMLAHFISFYKKYLKSHSIFFKYDRDEKEAVVVCLTDLYDNNFRIVIVPKDRLEAYFIGDPKGTPLTLVNDETITDALRQQMTVFSYSDYKGVRKCKLPRNATALDFAFVVSEALALTVKNAYIQKHTGGTVVFSKTDHLYPLKTILNEGDVVYFDADYSPHAQNTISHAKIEWFSYITTEKARNCLINYFKNKLSDQSSGG